MGALSGGTPRHVTEDGGSSTSKARLLIGAGLILSTGLILSAGLILIPGPHDHHGGALATKAPVFCTTLTALLCVVLRAPLLCVEMLRAAKGQLRSRTDAALPTPRGSAERPCLQGAVRDPPTAGQRGRLLGPALGTAWGTRVAGAAAAAGAGPAAKAAGVTAQACWVLAWVPMGELVGGAGGPGAELGSPVRAGAAGFPECGEWSQAGAAPRCCTSGTPEMGWAGALV